MCDIFMSVHTSSLNNQGFSRILKIVTSLLTRVGTLRGRVCISVCVWLAAWNTQFNELCRLLVTKITVTDLAHFHPNNLIHPYMSLMSDMILKNHSEATCQFMYWRMTFLEQSWILPDGHRQEKVNLCKVRETYHACAYLILRIKWHRR